MIINQIAVQLLAVFWQNSESESVLDKPQCGLTRRLDAVCMMYAKTHCAGYCTAQIGQWRFLKDGIC